MTPAEYEALQAEYLKIPKAVLDDLHRFIRPDISSFTRGGPEGARQTDYNEGLRACWLHITKRRTLRYDEVAVKLKDPDE